MQVPEIKSLLDEELLIIIKSRTLSGQGIYGLEILNEVNKHRKRGNWFKKLSFATLYPALDRLEKKGLVKWRWGDDDEKTGGGRRKYYYLSSLGKELLYRRREYLLGLELDFAGEA